MCIPDGLHHFILYYHSTANTVLHVSTIWFIACFKTEIKRYSQKCVIFYVEVIGIYKFDIFVTLELKFKNK